MPRKIIIAIVVVVLSGAAYFFLGSGFKADAPAPPKYKSMPSVGMPGQAETMENYDQN